MYYYLNNKIIQRQLWDNETVTTDLNSKRQLIQMLEKSVLSTLFNPVKTKEPDVIITSYVASLHHQ